MRKKSDKTAPKSDDDDADAQGEFGSGERQDEDEDDSDGGFDIIVVALLAVSWGVGMIAADLTPGVSGVGIAAGGVAVVLLVGLLYPWLHKRWQ